jgi:Zn-finger nucleic acid-binding protein
MKRHEETTPVVLAEPGIIRNPEPTSPKSDFSMKCPIDGEALVMTDRSGVEIDYCPKCRGVWLDRGELDKIIERTTPVDQTQPAPARAVSDRREYSSRSDDDRGNDRRRDRYDDDDREKYSRKKRSSLLDDLFDF